MPLNKYGSKLLPLPVPKLIVFYNGEKDVEDEIELKLSDSFPEGSKSDVEVRVRMINVNYGRNTKLLESCKPLQEYSWLVNQIRSNQKNDEIESAIDRSISEMPDGFVIKPFLLAHRSEVKGMLLTEYNEAATMELFKADGVREGTLKTLFGLVKRKLLSPAVAAKEADMTEEDFDKEMKKYQQEI